MVMNIFLIDMHIILRLDKWNDILYNNKMDKNVSDLQSVLKEKDELYKSLTTPQPYCGKNRIEHTTDVVAPYGEYSQYIMYWSLSTQFQTYNQLLDFVSENMTENMIQELKSKNNNTFDKNLYIEKDNKLYCGHVGAGYYPPKYTLYRISKYDDNKIIGTATDIYDDETVKVGIVKKQQYQNDIILVKENNIWKIDSYESELINGSNTDCSLLEESELKKCLKNSIDNGVNYTKEELIDNKFEEVNIDKIDLSTNLSLPSDLTSLQKFDKVNNVKFEFAAGGSASLELNNNDVVLTFYDESNESIKRKKVSNIDSMYYYKVGGLSSIHYVYLIDNDKNLLELQIKRDGSYKDEIDNEFKKLNMNYKYTEIYSLYQYSTTSGAVRLNLAKDETGKLRFITNEKIYNEKTYKVVNDKVSIIQNRDIYFDDALQSYKLKLELDDFALLNKVNYILSNENYLYNDSLQLQYEKKVDSILNNGSTVIVIYEDGKNLLLEYIEIK